MAKKFDSKRSWEKVFDAAYNYAFGQVNTLLSSNRNFGLQVRSLRGIDEGTVLYKFKFFARETGIIPVHGRKWGCNFLIAAQETSTIQNSISGNEIFKNLDNIFCGYIKSPAIAEMESLDFYPELLQQYTTAAFRPSKEFLQSYWYLKRGERHLEVTIPPAIFYWLWALPTPMRKRLETKLWLNMTRKLKV